MPIPARNYTELKTGKEGVLFLVEGPLVAAVERAGYADGAPLRAEDAEDGQIGRQHSEFPCFRGRRKDAVPARERAAARYCSAPHKCGRSHRFRLRRRQERLSAVVHSGPPLERKR